MAWARGGISCPNKHINVYYAIALQLVAQTVAKELKAIPPVEHPQIAAQRFHVAQTALLAQRQQIQSGYEARLYTQLEAHQKIVAIETDIEKLTRQHERTNQQDQQRQSILQLASQDITHIQNWILHDDPTTVNRLLTALCQTIQITPRYELQIIWR